MMNKTTFHTGAKGWPKEPFHLVANRTPRRHVQDLQHVVSRELAAPYTVKYLPDTGQIVLTPETRVVQTVQREHSMEERLIMAVWRIRSLQLSRTEARYMVGSMTYGVVWHLVYGMLRQQLYLNPVRPVPIRETNGHPWRGVLPPRPHRPLVQMASTPTPGHHAAWEPTAASVAYCGGWYIEA